MVVSSVNHFKTIDSRTGLCDCVKKCFVLHSAIGILLDFKLGNMNFITFLNHC